MAESYFTQGMQVLRVQRPSAKMLIMSRIFSMGVHIQMDAVMHINKANIARH